MESTPVTLLQQLYAGPSIDSGAWRRFVEMFAPLVFQWARRHGLQDADAEETVQDVFVTLLRRMRSFEYDAQGSFRAWLSTITRHEALRRLKKDPAAAMPADVTASVEESADERREYAAWIMQRGAQIIARDFDAATWNAFRAYVLEDRPAADVAAEQGMTRNAVYLARNRVLVRLREVMAGLLD